MSTRMDRSTVAENVAWAIHELEQCHRLLVDAPHWSDATPCEGWDVDALARHIAAVSWQQAEAFHRARVGVAEAPSWLAAGDHRDAVLALIAGAQQHLSTGSDLDERAIVPLPFAPMPAPIAAAVLVLEYGVHRADIERSLLGAPADRLDPFVARTVAGLLPSLVPLIAENPPSTGITYRLRGDTATVAITSDGSTWRSGEGAGPVCEIHGSDAAVALLTLGRISADHPSLSTNDPAAAAAFANHLRRL
jgi:uncharacterized protein (TIGR03083 family)